MGEKQEARSQMLRLLQKAKSFGPPTREKSEGAIEALFFYAATVVAAVDDLGFDTAVIQGLVDRFWETADEWAAEQKRIRN